MSAKSALPTDTVRLNEMADAVTSVCGWLPLSVRYEAAKAALARIDVYGATCQWCGCVGFHSEVCPGFEINDPVRTDGPVKLLDTPMYDVVDHVEPLGTATTYEGEVEVVGEQFDGKVSDV